MSKKIIMACMAVVALAAFALPSSASASKMTVTHPTGTTAATPLNIIGTNTDVVATLTDINGNKLTQCTSVFMTGKLEKNTHAEIAGTIEKAEFKGKPNETPHGTECESSFGGITVETNPPTNGLPWCLRSTEAMAADEVQIRGNSCPNAARPIRFVLNSTTIGKCTYQRTEPVIGTITTHPTAALIHIEKQKFTKFEGGFLCPGEGYLDMTMDLFAETEAGKEVPLYIDAA